MVAPELAQTRAPAIGRPELAWALARFEMGCERSSELEALSDHLLALRALLEPEGPAAGCSPAGWRRCARCRRSAPA